MDTLEDVVVVLNDLLNAEMFDVELLERSVNQFTELCESKTVRNDDLPDSLDNTCQQGIGLMDFELHSEEKKEQARLLKVEKILLQNFEYAANMRDVEKECGTYLEFKKHHGLEKSAFVVFQGYLIYAYFGTAINDQLIREFLEKGKKLKIIQIRYEVPRFSEDTEAIQ